MLQALNRPGGESSDGGSSMQGLLDMFHCGMRKPQVTPSSAAPPPTPQRSRYNGQGMPGGGGKAPPAALPQPSQAAGLESVVRLAVDELPATLSALCASLPRSRRGP